MIADGKCPNCNRHAYASGSDFIRCPFCKAYFTKSAYIKSNEFQTIAAIILAFFILMLLAIGYIIHDINTYRANERPKSPIVQLECSPMGDDNYTCSVIKISDDKSLSSYHIFLMDPEGRTIQNNKIELQNLSGEWYGIDVTWDDNGGFDTEQENGVADRSTNAGGAYSDPAQAQSRIDSVKEGYQSDRLYQRGEGTISVSFYDYDQNNILSAGDAFHIQGNSSKHKANDEYRLQIRYIPNDDVIGTFRLG